MSISFSCPSCDRPITVADKFAGQRGRCPGCSQPVTVPAAQPVAIDPVEPIELPSPVILPSANLVPAPVTTPATASMPVLDPQSEVGHYLDDDHDEDDEEGGHHSHSLLQHKDKPHEDLIDMTPMVDIVFFLLIFFLTTTLTAVTAVMNLPKPEKATDGAGGRSVSEVIEDRDSLTVKIQEDDTFWIEDEQFFSDQDLRMRIRTATAEAGRPLALIVVGNSDASYGAAIRVIDAGADAKVGSVSLLIQEVTDD